MIRQIAAGVLALGLMAPLAQAVGAAPVEVKVMAEVPEGKTALPITWSAVPTNLPPEADVLEAMIITPDTITGPWVVSLDPGEYVISGFTAVDLYEATVTVTEAGGTIVVPILSVEQQVAMTCTDTPTCDYTDTATGLSVTLPQGWALDLPYRADLGDGTQAPEVSTVLFETAEGDGGAVWFLNPVDWIEDDNGPCRDVPVGRLCTFDVSAKAEAAFVTIAPSLRLIAPDPAAKP